MSTTTMCPCCHRLIVNGTTTSAAFPFNLVPGAEIELIHNEASRLRGSINQIHGVLAVLSRKLNAIQSATWALPPETLSHIFQYACAPTEEDELDPTEEEDSTTDSIPSYREPTSLLTLGSVSTQWRDVAWSTPRLWSVLHFKLEPEKLTDHISLIKLFLSNSGSIPLDITLDFSGLWDHWYQHSRSGGDEEYGSAGLLDPSIDSALFESMSRIESLSLLIPPSKWIASIPQFSQLTNLSITLMEHETVQDLCLVNCTSLLHLTLNHFLGRIRLPSSPSITSVALFRASVGTALQLLFHCCHLIHFDGSCLELYPFETSPQFSTPTTLEHLRTFRLDAHRCDKWHDIIMQYLHLPVLDELHWVWNDIPWPNTDTVKNFFHRLPSAFKTLCFSSAILLSDYSLVDLFPNALGVECITLVRCNRGFISDVAKKLTAVRKNGPPMLELFPKLRKLAIVGSDMMFELTNDRDQVVGELFTMLEKRLELGDNRFCLDIPSFSALLGAHKVRSTLEQHRLELELSVLKRIGAMVP